MPRNQYYGKTFRWMAFIDINKCIILKQAQAVAILKLYGGATQGNTFTVGIYRRHRSRSGTVIP